MGGRTRAFVWSSLLLTKEWLRFSLVPNGGLKVSLKKKKTNLLLENFSLTVEAKMRRMTAAPNSVYSGERWEEVKVENGLS